MAWIYAVVWVAALAVSYTMMPKAQNTKPVTLSELTVPTAEEGREIPVLFGTAHMKAPMVVWYGDLSTKAIRKAGGKK